MLITLDQTEYKRLDVKSYALEKRRLQIELLKPVSYTHLRAHET